MASKTLEIEDKFQEILPPPIIFETTRSEHRTLKSKPEKEEASFCPHCGFSIKK